MIEYNAQPAQAGDERIIIVWRKVEIFCESAVPCSPGAKEEI